MVLGRVRVVVQGLDWERWVGREVDDLLAEELEGCTFAALGAQFVEVSDDFGQLEISDVPGA